MLTLQAFGQVLVVEDVPNRIVSVNTTGDTSQSTRVILGPQASRLTIDSRASDNWPAQSGWGSFLFEPTFRDQGTSWNDKGIYVRPLFDGSLATGSKDRIHTCYNLKLTFPGGFPIPAGTKGVFNGYEVNMVSAQNDEDVVEPPHGFGGTYFSEGSAGAYGAVFVRHINAAGPNTGIRDHMSRNVAGGEAYSFRADSVGAFPGDVAFLPTGRWLHAMDCRGNDIYRVSKISFSVAHDPIVNTDSSTVPAVTDYSIESAPDTLRIVGGGAAGGMIVYADNTAGQAGRIRFRTNRVDEIETARLETGDGSLWLAGPIRPGNGVPLSKILSGSAMFDPPGIEDGKAITTTVTVPGASLGDTVLPPSHSQIAAGAWMLYGYVSAADTVIVVFLNHTGATANILNGTLRVAVLKL
jgi:hypothetical protein